MELTLFQTVNYLLILLLIVLFLRYIYILYTELNASPDQWQFRLKNGGIPPELRKMAKKYPDKSRFFNWWLQIERMKMEKVPGVFVELGVYQGESAAILHQMDPGREFHLFDTFTGFSENDLAVETGEAATYTTAHFADTSVEAVVNRINGGSMIFVHAGQFPASGDNFSEQIALANLDVDLYKPTMAGLSLFYSRLVPGGVLLVHDYNYKWPGIIRAVDEFLKTIPESPVFVPDRHGTVMIIRNK